MTLSKFGTLIETFKRRLNQCPSHRGAFWRLLLGFIGESPFLFQWTLASFNQPFLLEANNRNASDGAPAANPFGPWLIRIDERSRKSQIHLSGRSGKRRFACSGPADVQRRADRSRS